VIVVRLPGRDARVTVVRLPGRGDANAPIRIVEVDSGTHHQLARPTVLDDVAVSGPRLVEHEPGRHSLDSSSTSQAVTPSTIGGRSRPT
jgi:hypothetical protein